MRRGTPRGLSSFVRSSIRVSICPSSPFRLNLSWSCVRSFVRPVRVWCVSLRLLSTTLATGRDYRLCVKVHLCLTLSLSPRFSWRARLKRQDGCRLRNGDVSLPGDCRLQEAAAGLWRGKWRDEEVSLRIRYFNCVLSINFLDCRISFLTYLYQCSYTYTNDNVHSQWFSLSSFISLFLSFLLSFSCLALFTLSHVFDNLVAAVDTAIARSTVLFRFPLRTCIRRQEREHGAPHSGSRILSCHVSFSFPSLISLFS